MAADAEDATDLYKHNPKYLPNGFGLNNTGSICHFNSLLQSLLSCSAFNETILKNEEYMGKTKLGRVLFDFVSSALAGSNPSSGSARVLGALIDELATKKQTRLSFGHAQESASEGLIFLLEMLEPSDWDGAHIITRLFEHCFEATIACNNCKHRARTEDLACHFELFGMNPTKIYTPETFVGHMLSDIVKLDGYRCDSCGEVGTSMRRYRLAMIPEILVCLFNVYHGKTDWYFPRQLTFKGVGCEVIQHNAVAQIVHSGSLNGGHYTARGIRSDGLVWNLNDTGVSQTREPVQPTYGTYMVFYTHA
jgi:ubiquitin C-terminal hydrolase